MLRSISTTLALVICTTLLVYGQEIRSEEKGMIRGVHPSLVMDIPEADKSFTEKKWKEFMKKYGSVEKVRKTQEWLLQSAHLVNYPDIDYANIYAEAMSVDTFCTFTVWIQTDSLFINPDDHPSEWASGEQLMKDFALKVKIDLVNEELEAEQKALDKLRNEYEKLANNYDKYVSTIDQSHKSIENAEADIVVNQREQEEVTSEMQEYGKLEADPDAQKVLGKLEKKMAKLKKQNLNYHNTIAKNQDRISQNEANIEQNKIDQEEKEAEIETQEAVVQDVRDRLSLIRAGKD